MFQEHYKDLLKTDDSDILDMKNVSASITYNQNTEQIQLEECIVSGNGFTNKEYCTIDEDAFGENKIENKKYVIFIYGLDKTEYDVLERRFIDTMKNLSVRVVNSISLTIGFRNFLVNYLFASQYKLLQIKNFGRKSVFDFLKIKEEFIDFVKECYNKGKGFVESSNEEIIDNKNIKEETLKENLGVAQYKILERNLNVLMSNLSVRSQNGIRNYKGDFIEDFVVHRKDIKMIKNIGKKSELEILSLVNKISMIANEMLETELTPEQILILEKETTYGDLFDEFSNDYLLRNNHLPMFHILENYLKKELETSRDLQCFNRFVCLFDDVEQESLDDIAKNVNLSRERIRQICSSLNNQLKQIKKINSKSSSLDYSDILGQKKDWQYVVDLVKAKQLLDIEYVEDLKVCEKTSLSDYYILLVISVLCEDVFDVIGLDLLPMPTRAKSLWNHSFLIDKSIVKYFDFNQLPQLINEIEEDSEDDFSLSVDEMLLDAFFLAWSNFDTGMVNSVSDILTHLLINEFEKIPDENFKFTFEGRKRKSSSDIIYKILEENGNPMTIEEIYLILEDKSSIKYKSCQSIKHFIYMDPRLCMVGTGTYVGLIEWKHVKIGGVRDVISQYLARFDEPVHIGQIIAHVQQYRDSSDNSIRATISSGDQFVQFSGGFYGLKDKTYHDWFYVDESERIFAQRIDELENFLESKGHFPFSPSDDSLEESLYRWWNKAKKYSSLTEKQKKEVDRVISSYSNVPNSKRTYEWYRLCSQYLSFIKINERKPDKRIIEESELDKWFHKAQDDFLNGNLEPNQERAFIELCKIL